MPAPRWLAAGRVYRRQPVETALAARRSSVAGTCVTRRRSAWTAYVAPQQASMAPWSISICWLFHVERVASALQVSRSRSASGTWEQLLQQLIGQPAAARWHPVELQVDALVVRHRSPSQSWRCSYSVGRVKVSLSIASVAIHLGQVVQGVQALGLVQVLELRSTTAAGLGGPETTEQLVQRHGGPAGGFCLRVLEDAASRVAAVLPLDADQVAQQVAPGPSARSGPSWQNSGTMPASIFLRAASRPSSSAIWKRQAMRSRNRPEACVPGLWRGAASKEQEALGPRLAPGLEFGQQPALADAGVGHHRHARPAGSANRH